MTYKVLLTLVISIVLSGCYSWQSVSAPSGELQQGKVRVTIERPMAAYGAGESLVILANKKKIGTLGVGGSLEWDTEPGEVGFSAYFTAFGGLISGDNKSLYENHFYFKANNHYILKKAYGGSFQLYSINGELTSEINKKEQIALEKELNQQYTMAVKTNEEYIYQKFLKKYPNSKYTNDINYRLATLEYQYLKRVPSIQNYSRFLKKYPNSKYSTEIQNTLVEIEYKNTLRSNSLSSYQAFVNKYPTSKHSKEFSQKIELLVFGEKYAGLSNNIKTDIVKTDLKNYLKELDYKNALMSFRLLDKMNVRSSPALTYYYAQTLDENNMKDEAKKKCESFLNRYGKTDEKYYFKTIELYNRLR